MKTIALGILLFVFWTAFYTLSRVIHEEKYILIGFIVCLVISMVTSVAFLGEPKK